MHASSIRTRSGPLRAPRASRRTLPLLVLAAAVAAALVALAAPAEAVFIPALGASAGRTISLDTVVTNGTIRAVAVAGNIAYIGGGFTEIGAATGSNVPVDPTSGALSGSWPRTNGYVLASVPDGAGGWYIGGNFTVVGGTDHQSIAHITSAGAVDTAFAVVVEAYTSVQSLLLSGSTLYIGGTFGAVNGTARSNAAAVDATTGALLPFNPGPNGEVRAFVSSGSDLYIGGWFTTLAGGATTRNHLAAVDATTGVASTWNPDLSNGVDTLVVSGSTIYAGGSFATVNGGLVNRNNVAAFDTTTATATAWNPDVNGPVDDLKLSGGIVYAAGSFTTVNQGSTPATRNNLAAFDSSGVVTSFDPNLNGEVRSIASSGTTLYAGGWFTTVNGGTARAYAAAFNTGAATGNVLAWSPAPGQSVQAVSVAAGRVLIGGAFNEVAGTTRNHVAAIDLTTGQLTGFNPNVGGWVDALALGGSTLYVGGDFTTVNGSTTRNRLAEVSLATGTATSFDPNLDGWVYALDLEGSTLFAGGNFTHVNSPAVARNYLAAFATSTGSATSFNPNPNNAVWSIVAHGSTLYAGGSFTTVNGGAAHNRLAALDTGTGTATTFDPNMSSDVYSLALNAAGTVLYAGGDFTTVNGATLRNHAAAFDTTLATANVLPFNPNVNARVLAIVLAGSSVYLGGEFQASISPLVSHMDVVRANATTGVPDAWDPALHAIEDATVYGIALVGDEVLLVGDMDSAGETTLFGLALIGAPRRNGPTPPVSSAVALPGTPVSVAVSKTGDASQPTVTVTAPAGAFNDVIGVTLGMSLPSTTLATPAGFKAVGTTVSIVVTGATPDRITTFAKPIEIVYLAPEDSSTPSYSADGVTWTAIPQIAVGSATLPAGLRDGWFKDVSGHIHILTLHATYYGLLLGGTAAPAAVKSTALTLTFGVKRTPKLRAGGVTVFFQPSKAVTATATLTFRGKVLITKSGSVDAKGAGALRLAFPETLKQGTYRMILRVTAGSEHTLRSVPIVVG